MSKQIEALQLTIDAPGRDKNELEDLTTLLRKEIEQLDVESIEPVSGGNVPNGAMAGDWFEIGALTIKMATAALPPLIALIQTWITLQNQQKGKDEPDKEEDQVRVKIKHEKGVIEIEPSTQTHEIVKDLQNQINAIVNQ